MLVSCVILPCTYAWVNHLRIWRHSVLLKCPSPLWFFLSTWEWYPQLWCASHYESSLLFFLFLLSHGIYIYSSSSFRKTISPQFLASCFPSLTEYMTKCCIPGGCFYLQSLNYYTTGQLCLLGPRALFTSPLMWFFLWVLGFIFLHLTCL